MKCAIYFEDLPEVVDDEGVLVDYGDRPSDLVDSVDQATN